MIKCCKFGKGVKIPYKSLVNIYDATIGAGSFIGPFVEITKGVIIGKNCRIQSHSFICGGVTIGDNVFVGHSVAFCNDKYPKVNNKNWIMEKTYVGNGSSIGSNATILPVRIGKNVLIGAGTVVSRDVPDNTTIYSSYVRVERRDK